jgi:hypothetical protein
MADFDRIPVDYDPFKKESQGVTSQKYDAVPVDYDPFKETGSVEALGKGIVSGYKQINEAIGTGVEYLGHRVGSATLERLGREAKEYWKPDEVPIDLQGSITENPKLLANPAWWNYNLAQTGISMLPGMIVGVGVGGAAFKGLNIAGTKFKLTPKLIERLATLAGATSGGVVGGAQEGTSTYNEVLRRGGDEKTAARSAEMMTAASGMLNAISFGKILKPNRLRSIKQFLKTGSTESLTEYLEEPAEVAIKISMLSEDKFSSEEAINQLLGGLNVAPIAFVTGGAAGSAVGASQRYQMRKYSRAVDKLVESGSHTVMPDPVLDKLAENTEKVAKERPWDKKLQKATGELKEEKKRRRAKKTEEPAPAQEVAAEEPVAMMEESPTEETGGPVPVFGRNLNTLTPEFLQDVIVAIETGHDKTGEPFSLSDAETLLQGYKSTPDADPEAVSAFEGVIQPYREAAQKRKGESMVTSFKSDLENNVFSSDEQVFAARQELASQYPAIADQLNKAVIEYQGSKLNQPAIAPEATESAPVIPMMNVPQEIPSAPEQAAGNEPAAEMAGIVPKGPRPGDKAFIENKIRELGSIEAVNKFYSGKDMVSDYARTMAPKILGAKPEQESVSRETKEPAISKIDLPKGWTAEIGRTRTKEGHTAEAEVDWRGKRVVFSDQKHMDNPEIWNHEVAHIAVEELPAKDDLFKDYIDAKKEDWKKEGYDPDWIVKNQFHRESIAMDYGNYLNNPDLVDPALGKIFKKYFKKEKPNVTLQTKTEVKSEPPAIAPAPSRQKGPQNAQTFLERLGGVNFSADYNRREIRQNPNLKRLHRATGLQPDEAAAQLNEEGIVSPTGEPWTGDSLKEAAGSGELRNTFTPEKQDVMFERQIRRAEDEYIQRELEKLEIEPAAVSASLSDIQDGLSQEIAEEGLVDPADEEAALEELDTFFTEKAEALQTATEEKPEPKITTEKVTSYGKPAEQAVIPGASFAETFGLTPSPGEVGPGTFTDKAAPKQAGMFETAAQAEKIDIEDFGEKIGGARKDIADSFKKEFTDDDIASLPLSKIWPKSEVDAIEDPFVAAFAYSARDAIPTKPRMKHKVARWVQTVKTFRGLMTDLFNDIEQGKYSREKVLEKAKNFPSLKGFFSKVQLLENINRDQWGRVGEIGEYPNAYRWGETKADGKSEKIPSPFVSVYIDGRYNTFEGAKSIGEVIGKVNKVLESSQPSSAEAAKSFEVRGSGENFFINKKGDSDYRKLKEFKTAKEAMDFRRDHADELWKAWAAIKELENVSKEDVRRKENRPRTGKDYRQGKDVTPEQFTDTFGFRGVEFGNWVSQGKNTQERQGMLNEAYDAMMDLADIVGIPPKAISLNGTLGLGFGSRGSGWASAHYEPDMVVINLTKTRGAGTLAHEWFHALDNYFQRQRGIKGVAREKSYITYSPETYYEEKGGFRLSEARYNEIRKRGGIKNPADWKKIEGVRPEVEQAFKKLVDTLNASPMAERVSYIKNKYWSRIIERAARSFENYVIAEMSRKGYQNDYLANVVNLEEFKRSSMRYPYLYENEIAPVAEAFGNLFETIQTRETERGVEMYKASGLEGNGGITRETVESVFPGQKVEQDGDTFTVSLKNGLEVKIDVVPEIVPNQRDYEKGYGQPRLQEGEYISGVYIRRQGDSKTGQIKVVTRAGRVDLHHESIHFLDDFGILTRREKRLIDRAARRRYAGHGMSQDERIAEWLAHEIPEANTFIGRAWQKVRDFIDRLVNAFGVETAHGVVRNIRSGEIFGREPGSSVNMDGSQYRLATAGKDISETKLNESIKDEADAVLKTLINKLPANIHHMSMMEKLLKSPEWYSHPVMQRIVRLFMRDRNELYHQYFNHLASTHEVTREDKTVMDLAKELKHKGLTRWQIMKGETSKEYKDLMRIIDYGDTEYVRNHRKPLANQIKEFEEEIRRKGVSEDAIRVWKYYRQSYDAALDMMTAQMKEMIAAIEEEAAFRGMKAADFSEMYSTLKGALATMNQWRGFYAPRIRQGNWAVLAYRGEGAEREYYREHRWSEMSARRLANKLKREGWNIRSVSEIERLPEDIYQDIKTIDTAKAIESALDKMTRGEAGEGRMATTLKFNEELLQEVADMIRARGFRSSMIHRKPGDRVTRGYIEDPMERHGIYINNLARGFAKAKVAQAAYNELMGTYIKGHKTENGGYVKGRIFGGIDPKKEPKVYSAAKDYIEEQLRNLDRADRIIGLAKSIATMKFLGFSVRSALVNMTALIITVPPSIHQYVMNGKGSMMKIHRELEKAGKDYAKIMATGKLPEGDEGRFLLEQHRLGWDDPQYTRDAMSNMTKLHNRAWELTMEGAMWMFGKTEQWNRGTTMLTAYRIARKRGKNHAEAAELAKTASDNAHGVYGRATLPAVAWGRNPAAKVAQMLYVYAKFPHNYLQMLYDIGIRKHNIKAALFALIAPMIVAGYTSAPLKDLWLKPVLALLAMLCGKDKDEDTEKWVWDRIRDYLGGAAEMAGRYGLFGALGLDISGSISIGVGIPRDLWEWGGAPGGAAKEVYQAWHKAKLGDYGRAAEHLLPNGIMGAAPLRAYREHREGITTEIGKRVYDETGKPYMPTAGETAMRALGVRSSRLATTRARLFEGKRQSASFQEKRNEIYERYRAYLADPPGERDQKEHKAIRQEVREFNANIRDLDLKGQVAPITFESMRRQAMEMRKAPKKTRAMMQ